MHPLTESVCRTLEAASVRHSRLLIALSGGADSVALLRACHECQTRLGLEVQAAHLNHQIRRDSDADAAWVRALCGRLQVPLTLDSVDIAQLAETSHRGLEETARAARYQFLQQAAQIHRCPVVAVAHTANDQAETVLHNLLRGTGIAGLKGIPLERPLSEDVRILRPLLGVSRSDVELYLQELGQDYRSDSTNSDQRFTRNRIRHRLLPQLRDDFNPRVDQCLAGLARQADELNAALEYAAEILLTSARGSTAPSNEVKLRWKRLIGPPSHLLRTTFVQLWKHLHWPRQAMTHSHWQRLADLAVEGGREQFPGEIDVERVGPFLVLRRTTRQND